MRLLIGHVVVLVLLMCVPARAEPAADELRAATQAMLDAVAPGRADVWERWLHEDFVRLDENGTAQTRQDLLKEFQPLPAGLEGRMEIQNFRVVFKDDVGVATYEIQEHLNFHGQQLRSRFRSMDTWLRTDAGWRMLAQHATAELKDPPTIALSPTQLCAYSGEYALTDAIRTTIRCVLGGLRAQRSGGSETTYLAEVLDVFFVPGLPRTRRIFLRGANGEVEAFVDRREGEDVRWRRIGPAPR